MTKRNYHMSIVRVRSGVDLWQCTYCKALVTLGESRSTDCTHVYPVCTTCGGSEQSNECKPDCAACWGALDDPSVYVAGSQEKDA
jgi:hypothetical protein